MSASARAHVMLGHLGLARRLPMLGQAATSLTFTQVATHSARARASDFPRSRKTRGIRGIADLKRNP